MAEATLAPLALRDAATRLAMSGVERPLLDAQLLLAHALGVSRERLLMDPGAVVPEGFDALIERRAAREPIAYILGRKDFRYLTLAVDPRVLIPRPETELLVEVGLTLERGARVLDVGTGSGAVALALKHERPDLEVWGADVSDAALAVARENARRLGLEVQFVAGDLLDGLPAGFDAVVANLPYVAAGAELAPEIADHEPAAALFAGPDGLEVIRRLAGQLGAVPLAALEVGFDQADAVSALLRGAGFASIQRLRDLAGHERVVVARRA